jgi:hypothetical protein
MDAANDDGNDPPSDPANDPASDPANDPANDGPGDSTDAAPDAGDVGLPAGDPAGDGRPDGTDEAGHASPSQPVSGVRSPPRTGDPAVDAALAGAAAVQGAEPAEQLEVYVGTHRALQDRLADSGA